MWPSDSEQLPNGKIGAPRRIHHNLHVCDTPAKLLLGDFQISGTSHLAVSSNCKDFISKQYQTPRKLTIQPKTDQKKLSNKSNEHENDQNPTFLPHFSTPPGIAGKTNCLVKLVVLEPRLKKLVMDPRCGKCCKWASCSQTVFLICFQYRVLQKNSHPTY